MVYWFVCNDKLSGIIVFVAMLRPSFESCWLSVDIIIPSGMNTAWTSTLLEEKIKGKYGFLRFL